LHVVIETVAVLVRLIRVATVRYETNLSVDGLIKDPEGATMITTSFKKKLMNSSNNIIKLSMSNYIYQDLLLQLQYRDNLFGERHR
jgi:hypothetical protein